MQGILRKHVAGLLMGTALMAGTVPALAQRHDNFYNGARQGGHGNYQYDNHHDRRYYDNRDHGIGPGKGALIGGAGGAVLGAAFGGGLSGAVIGGAAGAGIGALIGKSAQDNRRYGHR